MVPSLVDIDFTVREALKFVIEAGKVQAVNIIGLEDYLVGEAMEVQKDAMEEDERRGMVEVYLETLLPAVALLIGIPSVTTMNLPAARS